ncbi:tetratricopeptide repeat protein [Desulfovibrio psychrotolerans]|uniref:Tetratricopeptide repeat protein n=1 Tax=Desulfovibrio psychrotolerans TaxID=415242 RepID=A0A7J0BRS5_9BACT|nr:tetratricopeptide repeat protein [Desulfovibrio psychrotolerans]GFM36416.1 hypothetical protein DSM19430T_11000 [Desulfovibrio psychrotolerans]
MCAAKEIGALNKNGMQALTQGNYGNAEFMLHQALRKATGLGAEAYTAKIQNNLGLVLAAQGKQREAAELFANALVAIERKIGCENSLYRSVLRNLQATGHGSLISGCSQAAA